MKRPEKLIKLLDDRNLSNECHPEIACMAGAD